MRCRRWLFTAFPVPPHAAAFERGCRHPFLSVPPRAATDAATHFYRCRRVLLLTPPPMFIGAAGSFPFPREKGSEKGSQKTCEGCASKPDFSQKSGFKSGCLWLRLAQDNILVEGRMGVRFTRGFSKFKSHWLNDPLPLVLRIFMGYVSGLLQVPFISIFCFCWGGCFSDHFSV